MFIWTVGDALAVLVLAGCVAVFAGAFIYAYARFYWRKLFCKQRNP